MYLCNIKNRYEYAEALSNAEIVNYTNIAQDCGVSAKSVKEYFTILEETMLGFFLPAYTKVIKRRVAVSPKFYYFDVAIPNHLLHRTPLKQCTDVYGYTLEHFVIQELRAYLSYRHPDKTLTYWHTLDNKYEVDAIIGDAEIGIEVKSTTSASSSDTKGLRAFSEEYPHAKLILLSMEQQPRMQNDIEIWPVEQFLQRLWQERIVC